MFNNPITNNIIENNQKPIWSCPVNSISCEALELMKDFIKYSDLDMKAMADLMYYDYNGFKRKLNMLKKQLGGK